MWSSKSRGLAMTISRGDTMKKTPLALAPAAAPMSAPAPLPAAARLAVVRPAPTRTTPWLMAQGVPARPRRGRCNAAAAHASLKYQVLDNMARPQQQAANRRGTSACSSLFSLFSLSVSLFLALSLLADLGGMPGGNPWRRDARSHASKARPTTLRPCSSSKSW